ncbi:MAG TPA: hypothetical protein VE195_09330, partial [Acidobacteriaceae bacterium]|nr:hypothetical protein [Acidobacteriaceae bacterium]
MVGPRWTSSVKPIHLRWSFLLVFLFCCSSLFAFTIGETTYVEYAASPGSFAIAHSGHVSPIYVDKSDDPAVVRAANDLQSDIHRVTTLTPNIMQRA